MLPAGKHVTSKETCYQQGNTLPAKKHVTSKETRDQQRNMLPAKKHVTSRETRYQQGNTLPADEQFTSREPTDQLHKPAGTALLCWHWVFFIEVSVEKRAQPGFINVFVFWVYSTAPARWDDGAGAAFGSGTGLVCCIV